jgi:RimJ/RimL family protein N-acetyltransferase
MEHMVSQFERLWCSDRLVYKPIVEDDESKDIVVKLWSDPVTDGLSNPGIRVPNTKAMTDKLVGDFVKDCTLALIVCLPAEEGDENEKEEVSKDGEGEAAGDKKSKSSPARYQSKAPKPGKPVGGIMLTKPSKVRSSSIGLSIFPEYQGKGYGRECINFVVDWGFRWGDCHRITIGTVSFNERATHLYKDMGFVQEARRRHTVFMDFQWFDMIDYSMLVDEWKALRGVK